VSGFLASPRKRRRLTWGAGFVGLAGLVAGLIIAFPSPGPQKGARISNIEGDVVKPDKPRPFAPREHRILQIARQFVATAVARRHVEDSWDLVCPSLRQGYTKERWAKGEIPVVPYPVDFGRWRLGYSFEDEVDLEVALFAKPKTKLRPVVFDLTLQRCKRNGKDRWLVSSFLPAPSGSGDFGSSSGGRSSGPIPIGTDEEPPLEPPHSSRAWLVLPLGILSLALAVVGLLGFKHWRGARIYRAYVRDRQTSSSRPS
jgi:hypothetical protein